MSTPGGGAVVVTPGGTVVGSADVAGEKARIKKRRSSRASRRRAEERARAEQLKRIEAAQKAKEEKFRKEQEALKKASEKKLKLILQQKSEADKRKILLEKSRLQNGVQRRAISQREADKLLESFIKNRTKTISTTREFGFVQPVSREKNIISRADIAVKQKLAELETKRFRLKRGSTKAIKIGLQTAGFGILEAVTGFTRGIKDLPKVIITLVKNPSLIKTIPKNVKRSIRTTGDTLRISPTRTLVRIGTEVFLTAGTGKILNTIKKVKTNTFDKLSPKFKPIKDNKINVIAKKGDKPGIQFELGTVGSLKKPLSKQLPFAGTTQPVVTTAQANRLLSFVKRSKVVRKPLPMNIEKQLPIKFKKSLDKFDNLKISKKEFAALEKHLQTKYNKSLLERSLYVDPTGKLRYSRLQIAEAPTASVRDILRGNFRLRGDRPQIIFFRNVAVEAFPNTRIFNIIKNKLKSNRPLNIEEIVELVKWQTKKSGKFKPIGSTTYQGGIEPELTLAPGELIKRVKKTGFTIVKGKKIPIVEARIIKGSKKLNELLDELKVNKKLNPTKTKQLKKLYKKETNVKFDIRQRRNLAKRPLFKPKLLKKISRLSQARRRISKKRPGIKRVTSPRKTTSRKVGRVISPRKTAVRTPSPRVTSPRKTTSRKVGGGIKGKKVIVSRRKSTKVIKNTKTLSKPTKVFNIMIKKRGKNVILNKRLIERDAKNFMAYELDTSLIRTARLVPTGKRKVVTKLSKKYTGAFTKKKKKFRAFKIKRKKKVAIRGYIEKKKYAVDTKREKAQLSRLIKRKRKTNKGKTTRTTRVKRRK